MNKSEQDAIFTVCLMAAFSDGDKNDTEHNEIKRIVAAYPDADPAIYQRVLLKQMTLSQAIAPLNSPELRQLAYEMAVCVCEADKVLTEPEKAFLAELRREARPEEASARDFENKAEAITLSIPAAMGGTGAVPPVISSSQAPDAELDKSILNYSILNGALELLPDNLATMAIVPLQMKMVYRIGKQYGYDLDRGHIAELAGAAGVGITSQVVEGFARKLVGGLLGKVTGGFGRKAGQQLASSAMSFASTYALGHAARQYYRGGRKLSSVELKELFGRLSQQAQSLHANYLPQIQDRARNLNPSQLLSLVRNS